MKKKQLNTSLSDYYKNRTTNGLTITNKKN